MNKEKIDILLVEDDKDHTALINRSFESVTERMSITFAHNLNEARTSIEKSTPDLIIADYILPDGYGTELIPANTKESPYPTVILTSHGDEKVAVKAMKAGAFDYIVKSVATLDNIPQICERIMQEWNHAIERKKAEKELKENEAKFQSILSSLYEAAIIIYDQNGKITALWGTQEMDKRYGIRTADAIGRPIREFLPTEQAEQRLAEIRRVFDNGEKILTEYMVTLPGGNYWHETSLSPMRDASGSITAVVGFIRDVTKRKQTEKELIESEERFRSLFEQAAVGIIHVALNGQFLRVNKRFCEITGYTEQEISGRSFKDITYPDDLHAQNQLRKRVLDGEIPDYRIEKRYIRKDGTIIWANLTVALVRKPCGEPDYFVSVVEDITERKKSEEQISKLSHAVEQTSNTIIITDTKGNIEYVNTKFVQLTGYSLEEVIGKNPRFLSSGRTTQEEYEELWDTITSGKEWKGEFCNRKKDGKLYWESASISPVRNDKGIITNFIAVKEDITERKEMGAALLQSEKLKSLGTIAAGIAHEFNNILAIIIGSAEVLKEGFKDDKDLKKGLSNIIKAGDDGAEIVSRMLTFAKSEKDVSEHIAFDMRRLIKQAIDFTMPKWRNMAQARGISYDIDKEYLEEIPEVLCNPTEWREVFINIINNALDAMPDGGSLSFSTRNNDDTVFISISDTGKGMSEDVKKRIFDPFFTTRRPQGTGLGMSVSYGVIMRHGGKIKVESEEGKGATFNLSIPIQKNIVPQRVAPKPETREIKANKLHILVVDDTKDICTILYNSFSRNGHKVKTVDNGTEAIELIRREVFDLVLCDLIMPKVSGYDVINVINKLEKRPKIGLMTGWTEKTMPIDKEALKVDFIANKPFNLSELARLINDLEF